MILLCTQFAIIKEPKEISGWIESIKAFTLKKENLRRKIQKRKVKQSNISCGTYHGIIIQKQSN